MILGDNFNDDMKTIKSNNVTAYGSYLVKRKGESFDIYALLGEQLKNLYSNVITHEKSYYVLTFSNADINKVMNELFGEEYDRPIMQY